ncbi:uncharacterized protein B0T15DRAFT_189956 [Chaetomium strumarium]|uniref:Uncharacterized protein n=1 Tax=Chaetomium strumarium TaxID=1170767 RepID=A0AAJ0GSK6_9PEZI|nr:hypothetical protein B0T15DRAFT_189956 [Chaetomium strumarium]
MQTVRSATAASLGSRVLGEIEETTLDEVLASARTSFAASTNNDNDDSNAGPAPTTSIQLKVFPIDVLNELVNRHFRATQSAPLAVTGRHRELLYVLVATLISAPHNKAVAIVDFTGRFEPLRLLATNPLGNANTSHETGDAAPRRPTVQRADLEHVHIIRARRCGASDAARCVASIKEYMLYGNHRSHDREWWGTVVIGGGLNPAGGVSAAAAAQVAVTADWKGWLRVDRAEVPTFWDMSAEEALADREKRQAAVEDAGWVATSPWGNFTIGRRERAQ